MAVPQLQSLSSVGLQRAQPTQLVVLGQGLEPAGVRLFLGTVEVPVQVVGQPAADRLTLAVRVPEAITPGIYGLRLACAGGISNALAVSVDNLPTVPLAEKVERLPVAMVGTIAGNQVVRVAIEGRKGQRLVAELESRRLGGTLDPHLAVLDDRGVQLAYAVGTFRYDGDARVEVVLPRDGPYTVELHDILYNAGNSPVRLKVGDLPTIDYVAPMGARRGQMGTFRLVGRGPLPEPFPFTPRPYSYSTHATLPAGLLTGISPRLAVDEVTEVAEAAGDGQALAELTAPVAITGEISKPGERDKFRVAVTPGQTLRVEVFGQRIGSRLDPVVSISNEQGAVLARNDDQPTTIDPALNFTVPAKVSRVVVEVADQQGRGGPGHFYRVRIGPTQPSFSVSLTEERASVPAGGSVLLRAKVSRAGYYGPLTLVLPEALPGVKLVNADIPAGVNESYLSLMAAADAPLGQKVVRLLAKAQPESLTREVSVAESPLTRVNPDAKSEFGLAVRAGLPLAVVWAEEADGQLPVGGSVALKLRLLRQEKALGPVRFSLLTTQQVPLDKNKKEDPNRAIRLAAPVQVAAQDSEATLTVLVPGDLPVMPYDLAVQAELTDAAGKTVLASVVSPARRFTPVPAAPKDKGKDQPNDPPKK
jgi:hypothetical protein